MRCRGVLLVGLLLGLACLPPLPDLTGKQCTSASDCGEGLDCVQARCCAAPCLVVDAGVPDGGADGGVDGGGSVRWGPNLVPQGDFSSPSTVQGWQRLFGTGGGWKDSFAGRTGLLELAPMPDGGRPLAQESFDEWRSVSFGDGGTVCASARLYSDGVARLALNGCPDTPLRIRNTCNHPPDSGLPLGPAPYQDVRTAELGAWTTVSLSTSQRGAHLLFLSVAGADLRTVYVDDVQLRVSFDGTCP
jgi:hypothetical protein